MKHLLAVILVLFFACDAADSGIDLQDWCEDDSCKSCSSDSDCKVKGNVCTDPFYCAHKNTSVSTSSVGCSDYMKRTKPSDGRCRCVESVCTIDIPDVAGGGDGSGK